MFKVFVLLSYHHRSKFKIIVNMNVISRLSQPVPKFFRVIRTIGLVLTAASVTVLTSGMAVPAIVTTIAGYTGLAGAVAAAVSQATVTQEPDANQAPDAQ